MSYLDSLLSTYGSSTYSTSWQQKPKKSKFDPLAGDGSTGLFSGPLGQNPPGVASSRQSGFPERIDVNQVFRQATGEPDPNQFTIGGADVTPAVDLVAKTAMLPGYLKERPLALFDTAVEKATGGTKPISEFEKWIKGVPVLGPLAEGVGTLFSGKAVPGVANAPLVTTLALNIGAPDTQVVENRPWDIKYAQAPGFNRISGPNGKVTLGDLREMARYLGITDGDIQDVRDHRRSAFDFGEHPTSENAWTNLMTNVALDPTNLLLFTPAFEARAAGLAGRAGIEGTKIFRAYESSKLLDNAVTQGLARAALGTRESAVAFARGDGALQGSLSGLSKFLKTATRTDSLTAAAARAYMGTAWATTLGTPVVANVADYMADHSEKGSAFNGFFEGLYDFADSVENNKPLSNSGLWNMYAAMTFPLHSYVKAGARGASRLKMATFGAGEVEQFAYHLGTNKANLLKVATKEELADVADFVDQKIALERLTGHPLTATEIKSWPELVVRNFQTRNALEIAVRQAREAGISWQERAQAFKEWHQAQGGGSEFRGIRQPFDLASAMEQWRQYRTLASHLAPMADQMGVTLGLQEARLVTKEHLAMVSGLLKDKVEGGKVSPAAIRALNDEYHFFEADDPYFQRILVRGAQPVSWKSIQQKLTHMKRDAASISEVTSAFASREAGAAELGSPRPGLNGEEAGNLLEGQGIGISRKTDNLSASAGFGESPTSLAEAQALREHPVVARAEARTAKILAESGFGVQSARPVFGGWKGGTEPSLDVRLAPMKIADQELAASLVAHAFDQNAAFVKVVGAENLRTAGVKTNGMMVRWEGIPSDIADEAYAIAARHFPDGFTFDRQAGVIETFLHDEADNLAELKAARPNMTADLKAALPPGIDYAGAVQYASRRIYGDFLDRERYTDAIRHAIARGDPRVHAFDARAADLTNELDRIAPAERVSDGLAPRGAGGSLGLGGRGLPRTPRDWGKLVPGAVTATGEGSAATVQLRHAIDASAGDEALARSAAELDSQVENFFPTIKERAKPTEGPEFWQMDPAEYNQALYEEPTTFLNAADVADPTFHARLDVETQLADAGIPAEQARVAAQVAEAQAVGLEHMTGLPAQDYLSQLDVRASQAAPPGSLQQAALAIEQAPPELRRAMIEEPPPAVLQENGFDQASPIEWTQFPDAPVEVGIPGGIKGLDEGTFSLWDMWRLRAQAIDPSVIPAPIREKLYTKIFRTQVRALDDPLDAFNRMAFSMLSPNTNLAANEALHALVRARDLPGVEELARYAQDGMNASDIGFSMQKAYGIDVPGSLGGAKSVSTNTQLGNIALLARRYLEHPDFFKIREGESLLQYAERLSAVTPGAALKVGNFGVMLGDPIAGRTGTIDSHMAEYLGMGNKAPKSQILQYRMANGEINPKVPEHLRDLPWEPPSNKVNIYGGDYAVANEALRALHEGSGLKNFDVGGYQWYLWDTKRGKLEPHSMVYPGAYRLPKMTTDQITSAYNTLGRAGFTADSPLGFGAFRPSEGLLYQGERGATQIAADGSRVIHLMETADVSTVIHELAHDGILELLGRRDQLPRDVADLLDGAERDLGVRNGAWTPKNHEDFAAMTERYFRDGQAPTPALQGLFDRVKEYLRGIYQTLKGSGLVKVKPEVRAFLDQLYGKEATLSPAEQAIRDVARNGEELGVRPGFDGAKGTPPEYMVRRDANGDWVPLLPFQEALNQAVREGRAPVPGLSHSLRELDPQSLARVNEFEAWIRTNYPRYRLEKAPDIASFVRPDSPAGVALKEYNAIGNWLFEDSVFSKPVNFMRWLTTPTKNSALYEGARQALYAEVINAGGEAKHAETLMQALQREVESLTASRRVHFFRDWSSLPADKINFVARQVLPADLVAKLGEDRLHLIVDRASSRYYRFLQDNLLKGGKRGALQRGLASMYEGFQDTPGVHMLYDLERATAKVYYHMFRFMLDPRWWMYNVLEADAINGARYGMGATRFAGRATEQGGRAAFVHQRRFNPEHVQQPKQFPGKFEDEAPGYYTGWNDNRNLTTRIVKAFDHERPQTTRAALEELGQNHPVIKALRDRFGESTDEWVQGLDRMMYDFDTVGVKKTIDQEVKALDAQGLLNSAEMKPFIERLYKVNQDSYDSLVHNLHGNTSRTNAERVLNSYWLYWPISYQLKAAKWLYDVLFQKAFGMDTKAGGAMVYANMQQQHFNLMQQDPEYAAIFNDNPTLWFAAQMLLPITPGDIGVSLSRPVRYGLSTLKDLAGGDQGPLGFLTTYKKASDPITAAKAILDIGPIYTIEQLSQIGKETIFKPNQGTDAIYHLN